MAESRFTGGANLNGVSTIDSFALRAITKRRQVAALQGGARYNER